METINWNLRHLFPNICEEDLKNIEEDLGSIYQPIIDGKKYYDCSVKYCNDSNYAKLSKFYNWDVWYNDYISKVFYKNTFYEVDFSSCEKINQLISNFIIDTNELDNETWTRENIKKVAQYISKEPALLPFFIIENSFNILSQLMGYESFKNISYYPYKSTTFSPYESDKKSKKYDFHETLYNCSLGIKHLVVFIALVEELCNQGVNLNSLVICNGYYNYFNKLKFEQNYKPDFHGHFKNIKQKSNHFEYHKQKEYNFDIVNFFEF